jgi:PIN domain nuclease of toxin-antitoxin system
MTWLVDTHTLLWALFEPGKLGRQALRLLRDPSKEIQVSPLSYWEISLKYSLGKLTLPGTQPGEIPQACRDMGLQESPLSGTLLSSYHRLPFQQDHRDPFDRMLIWQAIQGGHILISKDRRLNAYIPAGLKHVW